ncbi:MAG: hypothetical protein QM673_16490, partial [Gordonia sp. (in: high G+C Gram-positive bacteria)]
RDIGITAAQYFILEQLGVDEPAAMSRIAREGAVPQQTASTALAGLAQIGAVGAAESANHIGLALWTLTEPGAQLRAGCRVRVAAVTGRITDAIGTENLARAVVLLDAARDALAR